MTIERARFELALEQLGPDDGFAFERFANGFLATEMPDLRPVGGIHDGARDAFVYSSTGLAEAFIQHSTTSDWRSKIRSTIRDLRKAGHQVRHLTYTTPRAIASKVDSLRIELREDGVLLDVRDREYFLAHVTTVPARQQLAETLAQHYVDPLLSRRGVLRDATLALTDEEERVAATYLQLEVSAKDAAKAVTKSVFEALVLYSLREATPEALVGRPDLQKAVARFTPASERDRVHALLDGTLKRLVSRNVVKHHEREDAFTLGYEHRVAMGHRIEQFLAARASVLSEAEDRVDRIAATLGVDYEYDPTAGRCPSWR